MPLSRIFPIAVLAAIVLSWFGFCFVFVTRKRPQKSPNVKRDPVSITGIALQGASFAIVWGVHRSYFTPLFSDKIFFVLGSFAILIAIGSVCFTMSAVKTLGKEWSLTARVVEGHKLATRGPYAWVRHPIYTGMLGMLVATGIAVSYWLSAIISLILFFTGTLIRIYSEERLLRETFGAEFDSYSKRVSAIIPGVF